MTRDDAPTREHKHMAERASTGIIIGVVTFVEFPSLGNFQIDFSQVNVDVPYASYTPSR